MSFSNLLGLMSSLPTDKDCRNYLANLRWNGNPVCPHCQNKDKKIYVYKDNRLYKCSACKKQFTSTVGTIFEGSPIPLQKWFVALYLFSSHKKGISSLQLSKDITVTQPTAWYMLHRIRHAMNSNKDFKQIMQGIVEVDETYIGGKNKNKHISKRLKGVQGRSTNGKAIVFGLVQRGGNVITFPIKRLHGKGMNLLIKRQVTDTTRVITDNYTSYKNLNQYVFAHDIINHSDGKYVIGDIHTNTIEGFWSQLKKGLNGIYHWISVKHLHRYCDEFEYRYNTRKYTEKERFDHVLKHCFNTRLMFVNLTTN